MFKLLDVYYAPPAVFLSISVCEMAIRFYNFSDKLETVHAGSLFVQSGHGRIYIYIYIFISEKV